MDVTLKILGDGPHQYSSDVRVYDGEHQKLYQVRHLNDQQFEELDLGSLEELRKGYLLIDTVVHKGNNEYPPSVEYKINYGNQQVEHIKQEADFNADKVAFFHFKFQFCPRSPFC